MAGYDPDGIAAVMAEKEGAAGIICAPVLASIFEKSVDVPVAIIKPKAATVLDALDVVAWRIGGMIRPITSDPYPGPADGATRVPVHISRANITRTAAPLPAGRSPRPGYRRPSGS